MNTRKLTNDPQTPKDLAKTGGRWYPTLITLSNGEVLATAGHPGRSDAKHDNDTPEIFSPGSGGGTWRLLPQVDPTPLYPRMHVVACGDVLCVTPLGSRIHTSGSIRTRSSGSTPTCSLSQSGSMLMSPSSDSAILSKTARMSMCSGVAS